MKATIEAPVERKVTLEMTERQAKVLFWLSNWTSFSIYEEYVQRGIRNKGITEEDFDGTMWAIYGAFKGMRL